MINGNLRNTMSGTVQTQTKGYTVGNAVSDGQSFDGWFVGTFVPRDLGVRASGDVEIKWGVHEPGEGQDEWTVNQTATTISILLWGRDRISFPDGEVILEREGDYAMWGPGVPHRWRAMDHCVVLSVRWPSAANDSVFVGEREIRAYLSSLA